MFVPKKIAACGFLLFVVSATSAGQEVNARVESIDMNARTRVQDPDAVPQPSLPASTMPTPWDAQAASEKAANRQTSDPSRKTATPLQNQPSLATWVGSPMSGSASTGATPSFLGTDGQRSSNSVKPSSLTAKRKFGVLPSKIDAIESRNLKLGDVSEDLAALTQNRNAVGGQLRAKLATAKRAAQRAGRIKTTSLLPTTRTQQSRWDDGGMANAAALNEQSHEGNLLLRYGYGEELGQYKQEQKQRRLDRKARQGRRNKMKIVRH
jgi:hypothetical protein